MKIYLKDDYEYLVRNGCYPDGYVEGLGIVGSQTVSVMSTAPDYPNEKAVGIDRRTQFLSSIKVPVITPLIVPEANKTTHEELTSVMKKLMDENTLMPAFSQDLREMVYKLKEEIQKRRAKNYETIQKEKETLKKDPNNNRALMKIKKAEEENAEFENVENEIRILATSNQQYDMVTNYTFQATNSDVEYRGGFNFNLRTRRVELQFNANKPSLGAFAHELKHAYQFETGQLSGHNVQGSYFLYDKQDEREAFDRGRLFGATETFTRNASVYQSVPDSRDFNETIRRAKSGETHTWKDEVIYSTKVLSSEILHEIERSLKDPYVSPAEKEKAENELLKISHEFPNSAFRANGNTYYKGNIITNNRY